METERIVVPGTLTGTAKDVVGAALICEAKLADVKAAAGGPGTPKQRKRLTQNALDDWETAHAALRKLVNGAWE